VDYDDLTEDEFAEAAALWFWNKKKEDPKAEAKAA